VLKEHPPFTHGAGVSGRGVCTQLVNIEILPFVCDSLTGNRAR
jgi:hypothetical protein